MLAETRSDWGRESEQRRCVKRVRCSSAGYSQIKRNATKQHNIKFICLHVNDAMACRPDQMVANEQISAQCIVRIPADVECVVYSLLSASDCIGGDQGQCAFPEHRWNERDEHTCCSGTDCECEEESISRQTHRERERAPLGSRETREYKKAEIQFVL